MKEIMNSSAHSLSEKPNVHLKELFPRSVSSPGLSGSVNNSTTPDRQFSNTPHFAEPASPRISNNHKNFPKPPVNMSFSGSPAPSDENHPTNSPQAGSMFQTSSSEAIGAGEPWSSAVGPATLSKTGRVINKLMTDNERLKRELNLVNAQLDEETRSSEAARAALETERASNEHNSSMYDIQVVSIARKDRKIEELKAQLEAEKSRLVKAEVDIKNINKDSTEKIQNYKNEAKAANERAREAKTQHQKILMSWKKAENGNLRIIENLRADFDKLSSQRDQNCKDTTKHIDDVSKVRKEAEKSIKENAEYKAVMEESEKEREESMKAMKEKVKSNDETIDRTVKQTQEVLGQMKWVLNVKQDVKDAK